MASDLLSIVSLFLMKIKSWCSSKLTSAPKETPSLPVLLQFLKQAKHIVHSKKWENFNYKQNTLAACYRFANISFSVKTEASTTLIAALLSPDCSSC